MAGETRGLFCGNDVEIFISHSQDLTQRDPESSPRARAVTPGARVRVRRPRATTPPTATPMLESTWAPCENGHEAAYVRH